MNYINFQNEKLSKLSLGTVQFGLNYGIANSIGQVSETEVNNIVNYLMNNGLNCFDTAQEYGNSEIVLGRVLKDIDKKNLFLISKIKSNNFIKNLEHCVLTSLKNLNCDSLYALLLHDSNLLHNWNAELSKKVSLLKEKNLIKNFGISIYSSEDFNLALSNDDIRIIQIPFNIFDLRAIKEDWFDRAKENNKLIFIRSIFLQGLLLLDTNKIPDKLFEAKIYLQKLEKTCLELNVGKNELILSFVDSIARESILLFGCDSISQAQENICTYKKLKILSQSDIDYIIENFSDVPENIYLPTRW